LLRPQRTGRPVRWPGSAVSMLGHAWAFGSACPGCLEETVGAGGAGARAVLGHEPLEMTAVRVAAAGRAGACRGARHREDEGIPALVQGSQAGYLDRLAPDAVLLEGHEPLGIAVAVRVGPSGGAVAGRAARHH